MRLVAKFTIEESPAALRQVASVVGFAHSMGLALSLVPEEDPRSDVLAWGEGPVPKRDQTIVKAALRVLKKGQTMHRKEFVRATADLSGKSPKTVGTMVSRWLRGDVMREVQP